MVMHTPEIHDPALRLRAEWAASLCYALGECDLADAAAICCAYLDSVAAGEPDLAVHVDVRDTARWWSEWAHPLEIEATVAAGLRKLGRAPLGIHARKRLVVALWCSLTDSDRAAFLTKIDPNGKFIGRATR